MTDEVLLGRQPILDAQGALVAFELLFRGVHDLAPGQSAASTVDDLQATAHVIARALSDIGIADSLGPYPGYVNADYSLLMSDVVTVLPPARFVLEVLEGTPVDQALRERLAQLRQIGYRIALDDVAHRDDHRLALLPLVDIVKVDLLASRPVDRAALVQQLAPAGKILLAEKVETLEEFDSVRNAGFDLFQGYFFARPQVLRTRRASISVGSIMRLIALVEQEAEIGAIADELAGHPGLVTRLLRLVNASASGLSRQVDSIGTAIGLIGTRQLGRWAQLLLYADREGRSPHEDPLVYQVATRARLMELVAQAWRPGDVRFAEQAFMTGMLSKVDVLFGTSRPEALTELPLSPVVHSALCTHEGDLGRLLQLCEAREHVDLSLMRELCGGMPGVSIVGLADAETQAAAWTLSLVGALGGRTA